MNHDLLSLNPEASKVKFAFNRLSTLVKIFNGESSPFEHEKKGKHSTELRPFTTSFVDGLFFSLVAYDLRVSQANGLDDSLVTLARLCSATVSPCAHPPPAFFPFSLSIKVLEDSSALSRAIHRQLDKRLAPPLEMPKRWRKQVSSQPTYQIIAFENRKLLLDWVVQEIVAYWRGILLKRNRDSENGRVFLKNREKSDNGGYFFQIKKKICKNGWVFVQMLRNVLKNTFYLTTLFKKRLKKRSGHDPWRVVIYNMHFLRTTQSTLTQIRFPCHCFCCSPPLPGQADTCLRNFQERLDPFSSFQNLFEKKRVSKLPKNV